MIYRVSGWHWNAKMKFTSRQHFKIHTQTSALWWLYVIGALLVGYCSPCWTQETGGGPGAWQVTPRVSVGATYSDNIGLVAADEAENDFVLQVDPGISIRKQGSRLNLRLDYTAQGLLYTNNGDANKINNQLQAFGTAELYQQSLFLDAYGSILQVPIDSRGRTDAGNLGSTGGIPSSLSFLNNFDLGLPGAVELFNPLGIFSNIALTGNQQTGYRFGISPYWRQSFGGWAQALIRYRYDDVFYDQEDETDDQQPDQQVNGNSDSQINTIEFNLSSDREFSKLNWGIDYFYQKQKQEDKETFNTINDGDDRRERVIGKLDYQLSRPWSLLAEAGYENNQVAGFEDGRNGAYWGLGTIWTPNRFVELKGLYGPDVNEIALRWNPTIRTDLQISRRDQDVGVDPGVRWRGSFNHRTRNSVWSASYIDEVTNEQQLLGSNLLGVGPDGQPLPLGDQGQVVVSEGPFGLTDRNFRRKRFDAGITYRRGPTGLSINAFGEDREGQDATSNETIYGAGALWTWRFAPRTASFLGTGWERDDLGENQLGEDQENDYWVSVVGLARVFTPDSGGLISYRYYRNDADPTEQGFRENRFNIRFNMKF